jgi:hypothetical protein
MGLLIWDLGETVKTSKSRRLAVVAGAVTALVVTLAVAPAQAGPVPPSTAATIANANPANTTPHAQNGEVRAFAQIGNTVYVGGTFTNVKAPGAASWTARRYLFAYDRVTGAINPTFLPQLDGAVSALALSPDGKLIVAGAFKNVNGVSRKNLVAVNPTTGATDAGWAGRGDGGSIRRAVVRGNWLYVSGSFLYINGAAHSLFARLNATTGAIDNTFQINASVPRAGSVFGWALAISPDGNTMVGGGNFTQVNGQARNQIFVAENLLGTPAVANWSTDKFVAPCYSGSFPYYVQDIDFSDDGSYFAVGANGGRDATAYCDSVSRWETAARGSNVPATWVDFTGTDSVTSVEAADNVVYAGGHFRWMNNPNGNDAAGPGAIDRFGYAALDPSNGMPFNWNPTRSVPAGQLPPGGVSWGPQITELWKGSDGIYSGFDNDGTGQEYHGRMALFPYAGQRVVAAANPYPNATGYLYARAGSGQLARVSFNGTTIGTPTLTSQPNLTGSGAMFNYGGNRFWWSRTDASAPNGRMVLSQLSGGTFGASWLTSYSAWFQSATMSGAFALNGRMYYTKAGNNGLFYRYLENDGNTIGATEFTIPTQNLAWGTVRGLAWVNGKLLYGNTDGNLRSVAFDATAAGGFAVNGATATVVAPASASVTWNSPTLFFATS